LIGSAAAIGLINYSKFLLVAVTVIVDIAIVECPVDSIQVSASLAPAAPAPETEPAIYLASKSPRRRELLRQIGVPHHVIAIDVLEAPRAHELPSEYVQRLASEKAQAGWAALISQGLPLKPVLGADTIVVCEGHILEKPRDLAQGAAMLRQLAGAAHHVMTAVALASEQGVVVKLSITDVVFRPLDDAEISAYWHTGEPQDKAGGYAIQGLGAVFVQQIRGSYTGVVGLPIEQTVELLAQSGISWWQ
jgi:septum formation protein